MEIHLINFVAVAKASCLFFSSIMSNRIILVILFFLCISGLIFCKTEPFRPDFENAGGYVIAKETCNVDTSQDFWLIDLSIFPLPNNYGDSLTLNGLTYRHVVKTVGLAAQFKFIGARVGFDFHLSTSRVRTVYCNVANPDTYLLKEMNIISQAEIR